MERLSSIMPVGSGDLATHRGARRGSRRWALSADVEVVDPDGGRGIALNASAGGLRVILDRPLEPHALCVLRVSTSADRSSIEHTRVVWQRELPDGWVLGLAFVEPS